MSSSGCLVSQGNFTVCSHVVQDPFLLTFTLLLGAAFFISRSNFTTYLVSCILHYRIMYFVVDKQMKWRCPVICSQTSFTQSVPASAVGSHKTSRQQISLSVPICRCDPPGVSSQSTQFAIDHHCKKGDLIVRCPVPRKVPLFGSIEHSIV